MKVEKQPDLYYRLNVFPIRIPRFVNGAKTFPCWLNILVRSMRAE